MNAWTAARAFPTSDARTLREFDLYAMRYLGEDAVISDKAVAERGAR